MYPFYYSFRMMMLQ